MKYAFCNLTCFVAVALIVSQPAVANADVTNVNEYINLGAISTQLTDPPIGYSHSFQLDALNVTTFSVSGSGASTTYDVKFNTSNVGGVGADFQATVMTFDATQNEHFHLTMSWDWQGSERDTFDVAQYFYDLTANQFMIFNQDQYLGGNSFPIVKTSEHIQFDISGQLIAGHSYFLEQGGNATGLTSGEVTLTTSVPEPSTFAILGLGAVGLVIGAYRRRDLAI